MEDAFRRMLEEELGSSWDGSDAGTIRHEQSAAGIILDAGEVVVRDVEVAVEVDPVSPWGEMCSGGGAETGFDHAAEEDLQTVLACDGDHGDGGIEAAAFEEFDVHAINEIGESRNVSGGLHTFIGKDGWCIAGKAGTKFFPSFHAMAMMNRLLNERGAIIGDLADHERCFAEFPATIDVEQEFGMWRGVTCDGDGGEVEAEIAGAKLEFEDAKLFGDEADFFGENIEIVGDAEGTTARWR